MFISFTYKCLQSERPDSTVDYSAMSSKREIADSSPSVCKDLSFCNYRFLSLAHSSTQPIQMKLTVT